MPLQKHLGNRKTHKTPFVYSGTTFVGTSFQSAGEENVWFRFPWEFTQAALRTWETQTIAECYLFWKAHHISIEFKNPICIQDVQGSGVEVQSGQNLHAQLFAYQDNLYMTGIANTYDTRDEPQDEVEIEQLLQSWGNHGYDDQGASIVLPS